MPADFIPAAARRRAANIRLDDITDLDLSLVGFAVVNAGDLIVDPEPGIDRVIAVIAGDPVIYPDHVEVPVEGSDRPARFYRDTVTLADKPL